LHQNLIDSFQVFNDNYLIQKRDNSPYGQD